MNKSKSRRQQVRNIQVKPIYLFVIAVVFMLISIYSLRQNNYTMIKLRDAVTSADQENGDVEGALQDLRRYVYSHMNTNLSSGKNSIKPPVQLKARYDRLAAEEASRVKEANAGITTQAEAVCGAKFPAGGYNAPRVACVQEYVRANAQTVSSITESLYKFDFISPRWSPDLAGISLVLSGVFFALSILDFAYIRLRQN